jgi:hypothetical protein
VRPDEGRDLRRSDPAVVQQLRELVEELLHGTRGLKCGQHRAFAA